MIKKFPIGIQSFENIRTGEYFYVDKTAFVYQLASTGNFYFLSRPRRFGKSLLVSTMEAFFSGKKDLFEGLVIEKLEDENPVDQKGSWVKGPVIHLDFAASTCMSIEDLKANLNSLLLPYEQIYGKKQDGDTLSERFMKLIRNMYEAHGITVTILIDEYDKPLINSMHDEELNEQLRSELKSFYSVLKTTDQYTKFVFLTGVTKFSHVSIFSDLNNLEDISMNPDYNEICGFTEEEVSSTFGKEIEALGNKLNCDGEYTISKLTEWYDGYLFSRSGKRIFNPYSVLFSLKLKVMDYYWFRTGTPTFLIDSLKIADFEIPDMTEGIECEKQGFMSCRSTANEPLPLLYQSGYLTIRSYNEMYHTYLLGFPNYEVKTGFLRSLLPVYFKGQGNENRNSAVTFARAVNSGDVDGFMLKLKSLLASIPYDDSNLPTKHLSYEATYRTAVFLLFTLCGLEMKPEVHMANGRCDAVLQTETHVYVFEFKVKGTAEEAVRQIDEKGYALPYQGTGRQVVKIGVVFDPEIRNISEYLAVNEK